MSCLTEKVAYLDGLADGIEIEKDPNGKLLKGIIEVLGLIADELEGQEEVLDDLSDCVDDIYETLDECYDDDFVEITCPNCGETVCFDEDMLDSEEGLICPNCNEEINFGISDCDCDDCDCDCDDCKD